MIKAGKLFAVRINAHSLRLPSWGGTGSGNMISCTGSFNLCQGFFIKEGTPHPDFMAGAIENPLDACPGEKV